YDFPEPKFKRVPQGFDKNCEHIYLSLYGAMFAYKQFLIDDTFYSIEIVDLAFKIYDDMRELQKWVYEMTLRSKE
ncbi:MAG: DUF2461 domain-containing protein, partial [Campylobacterota bacterium]|nr:DUF2461 domain-containing protein [Campylobacterota bacterium]